MGTIAKRNIGSADKRGGLSGSGRTIHVSTNCPPGFFEPSGNNARNGKLFGECVRINACVPVTQCARCHEPDTAPPPVSGNCSETARSQAPLSYETSSSGGLPAQTFADQWLC